MSELAVWAVVFDDVSRVMFFDSRTAAEEGTVSLEVLYAENYPAGAGAATVIPVYFFHTL